MGKHAKNNIIFNLAFRRYLYGISTALMPILVSYGLLTEQNAILWSSLIVQVLATSTAYLNTPKQQEEE